MGKVDDGNTTSDYDPDEVKRKISLSLALLPCKWRDNKINLIDTPGYSDFVGEVKSAMRVCEGAAIVICAASSVEVGTEQVWNYCEDAELPRIIYINKMERENADFFKTMGEVESTFGDKCLPIQIPVGSQDSFEGIIDLMLMKYFTGSKGTEAEIPSSIVEQANTYRTKMIEAIAGVDEALIEKYLNDEELSLEELQKGLQQGVATGKIVPVLAGSATQNIGIIPFLDAICSYIPSPQEHDVITLDDSGKEKAQKAARDGSMAAIVFKTSADPYVGKLTYFRVYNGVLESNSQIWNSTRNEAERIGQLFLQRGKTQEPITRIEAGDMGVVAKLNVTNTGDTLCMKDKQVKLAPIIFPAPIFSGAVQPKSKADLDKLGSSLARLAEEDPTLQVRREQGTGETIMAGIGETQLEVAVEKMLRKFGVGVLLAMPKVPYKETITVPSKGEYKHKKQTGGHGQYGHVLLQLEPLPRSSGNEFVNKVVGGTIPRNYIPAVEKGVLDTTNEGGSVAGYPVVDIRTTVYDGSFHPVDSSEICFKIAGSQALKKGMAGGQPVLLEPIVNMKVIVPDNYTGDIIGDLNNKRARVQGMNPHGGKNEIDVQAPLAEIQRYAIDLKSMTQGRGTYTYTFSHYEEVPVHITQKIVAERQAEKEKE